MPQHSVVGRARLRLQARQPDVQELHVPGAARVAAAHAGAAPAALPAARARAAAPPAQRRVRIRQSARRARLHLHQRCGCEGRVRRRRMHRPGQPLDDQQPLVRVDGRQRHRRPVDRRVRSLRRRLVRQRSRSPAVWRRVAHPRVVHARRAEGVRRHGLQSVVAQLVQRRPGRLRRLPAQHAAVPLAAAALAAAARGAALGPGAAAAAALAVFADCVRVGREPVR